jgi:hypothetical protein
MHATLVILAALSGLGCQNKSCYVTDSPLGLHYVGSSYRYVPGPSVYSAYTSSLSSGHYGPEEPSGVREIVLDTLYSFFVGRSPGVPSPREIEASVFGYHGGY